MARRELLKRMARSRLGPNPQCIAGATIGLIGTTLPWLAYEGILYDSLVRWHYWYGVREFALLDVISGDALGLGLCCTIFLFGTLLSLLTPIGSIAQIVGLTGFAFGFGGVGPQIGAFPTWSLGLGYVLGIISTFVTAESIVKAMFAANNGKPVRMLGRFAALSPRTISSWR